MELPRASEIVDFPHLVAPLPYLNFLRYFKRKHPRYGTIRLLQEALPYWDALTTGQKNLFQKKRILARSARCSAAQRCRILKIKIRRTLQRGRPVRRPIYSTRRRVGLRSKKPR